MFLERVFPSLKNRCIEVIIVKRMEPKVARIPHKSPKHTFVTFVVKYVAVLSEIIQVKMDLSAIRRRNQNRQRAGRQKEGVMPDRCF